LRINKYIRLAILLSLGICLQLLDNFFILPINSPAGKIGIANIITLYALYTLSTPEAIILAVLRPVLGGLLYGGLQMSLYGLAGSAFAIMLMILFKKINKFSIYGVSIIGSVANNIAQIAIACIMLKSFAPLYYMPILVIFGSIAGVFTAYMTGLFIKKGAKATL